MEKGNTNWGKSVAAVVLRNGCVLLGRHTYGAGTGKLIIPGGYLDEGETAEHAVVRETLEETGVKIRVSGIAGLRTGTKDWYLIYSAEYVSGEAHPCDEENSEVVWMPVEDALLRDDVPDLSKVAIRSAMKKCGLVCIDYDPEREHDDFAYYG